MRIAILADIHGNLKALEAVLDDLSRRAIDRVVNLGDCVSGPLEAAATAERLMALGWPTVRGNHDRHLIDRPVSEMIRTDSAAHAELDNGALDWLAGLPTRIDMEDMTLVHATPSNDEVYLTETVRAGGVVLSSETEIAERLGGMSAPLLLCGHSHIQRLVSAGDVTIFNPGSVGLQAYDDVLPEPHVVEVGSPHARYAILDGGPGAWVITFRVVTYDWEAAARLAESRDRPDWAHALRRGFALKA